MVDDLSAASEHGIGVVPVIDISGYFEGDPAVKASIARQIDEACRSIGFLVISGHGVSRELIERTDRVTRAFFDLPSEAKRRYVDSKISRGYFGLESSSLAATIGEATLPDLKEQFSFGPFDFDPGDPYYATDSGKRAFPPNIVPTEIAGLEEAWTEYFDAMSVLATVLMRLFALGLGLDEHWFDTKIDRHMSNLTLTSYPDQTGERLANQMRAGAHTDYGSLTILKAEDKPGGLQVKTADGRWEAVPILPDTFIINIGDLMARWTNDRWVSTMHRVISPPADRTTGTQRQSLVYFHQPNYDAVIECIPGCTAQAPKYPPTTSSEHLWMKFDMMKV